MPQKKKPVVAASDDEEDIEMPETYDDKMWQKVCGRQAKRQPAPKILPSQPAAKQIVVQAAPEIPDPYGGLDNKAVRQLWRLDCKIIGLPCFSSSS